MPKRPAWRTEFGQCLVPGLALAGMVLGLNSANAQQVPELVDKANLRVCSDPANMPFSNRRQEGFENRIAEIVAKELQRPVRYYWLQQGMGFVRNTLGTGLCDVIIGAASGSDLTQHTNPYYASTYVLVVRADGPLAGVTKLEDPALKGRRFGIIAGTPPVDHLQRLGLVANARSYGLTLDQQDNAAGKEAIDDLVAGNTDGALLWGPIAGYYASKAAKPLKVIPLVQESERPLLAYRITFGIRANEIQWKHTLNAAIRKRQKEIEQVLADYGVPRVSIDSLPAERPNLAAGQMQE
ncbi:substrate-binding domain-containing protein [Labrys sp. LIt4]|uniref:Quinoprotein dehydrogenase-associated putative ABC transporter substrate-binding protein n=1 Tax=Labrys okinawensis TaxID=346911 RepID=A0A2S9Q8R4_9HYPH|nr:substrate-binding domain-containing protein [Labrys sp. LIt4]PRH85746.1 quinoprotein dehydrogenase-associated putative ABC transporter substrate-binding protein [Labrys okinawensis]